MTPTLFPHRHPYANRTTENPIFFHLTPMTNFKSAVDQLAEVGFEMIIYSFGSGFVMETNSSTYLSMIASEVAYAHAKSPPIEVGGYDLICLDRGYNGYGGNVGTSTPGIRRHA